MNKIIRFGNALLFFLTLLWLYFSIYFMFQYLNIDYANPENRFSKIIIFLSLLVILLFYFKRKTVIFFKILYEIITNHKIIFLLFTLFFQTIVLLSSVNLASADTTIIYSLATNKNFALNSDYISVYPNNYLLLLWFKINYLFAKHNLVVVLAIWNIIFIDFSVYLIYQVNKFFLNQRTANLSYILMSMIIAFSPQYIYTYSDSIALFTISLFLFQVSLYQKIQKNYLLFSMCANVVLCYNLRPPLLIFIIALLLSIVLSFGISGMYNIIKEKWSTVLILLLGCMVLNSSISLSMQHQNFVKYETGKSRTMLYFVDLGLTYSGNVHAEVSKEVLNSSGKDRNKLAILEIKKRLRDYKANAFIGHLYYKYYWIVGEGMFGWFQERVMSENSLLQINWLSKLQNSRFSKYIRSFIYVGNKNYGRYALLMQLIWIVISFGLFLSIIKVNTINWFILWMEITLFGAILFLMIFEGGRSRYLIQFLPAIISLSSFGIIEKMNSKGVE